MKNSTMVNIGKGAVGAAKLTANISKGIVAKMDKVIEATGPKASKRSPPSIEVPVAQASAAPISTTPKPVYQPFAPFPPSQ